MSFFHNATLHTDSVMTFMQNNKCYCREKDRKRKDFTGYKEQVLKKLYLQQGNILKIARKEKRQGNSVKVVYEKMLINS